MDLTLILGPMKSGKSHELISLLSPLQYSTISHRVYQSARHVRDTGVVSRSGGVLTTTKVVDLSAAEAERECHDLQIVGVDEVHMFSAADVEVLARLLHTGTRVVAAGLDLDHRGELFLPIKRLLELGPERVIYRRAVCEVCRDFTGTHTQVLAGPGPYLLPVAGRALPDDGTFSYEPRCRSCYVWPTR